MRALVTIALLLGCAACATTPKCEEACQRLTTCQPASEMLCARSCQSQLEGWQDEESTRALAAATQCVLQSTCEQLASGACAAEAMSIY